MQDTERWPNDLSLPFVEDLYSDYLRNPDSVPLDWRRYFEGLSDGRRRQAAARIGPTSRRPASSARPARDAPTAPTSARMPNCASLQDRVDQLIRNYRVRGHMSPTSIRWAAPARSRRSSTPTSTASREADMDRRSRPAADRRPDDVAHRARDPRAAAQHLLPLDRRAVHAHRRPGVRALAAGPHGGHREPPRRSPATSSCASSRG